MMEPGSGVTCTTCGATSPAGQRFCGECGSALTRACPDCGASNPPSNRFCGDCGTALAAGTVPTTGAARPAAPASPVERPGEEAPVSPAGADAAGSSSERRLVSVLFADLVGFTPFAEERDAEDVRDVLSRYFDLASDVINRHGGLVEKFIGDAVMAVWGTPTAREDDAERAVRAALELVAAVRGLGPTIQARAAVLTGEAAVNLGATNQGMVAGDLVNTAARLQSVAPPGSVLVGEATQQLAAGAIAFEPAGEHVLKGKVAPVPAWRATRVVAERGGRRRVDAIEAAFVGRDEELRLVKDLYHATAREQRTRLVSVTGVGGTGKSRLVWEFEKYIDGIVGTTWWHHGRSPAYGEGITFWALGEMVRQRARLAETDDEATTRQKVADMVASVARDEREATWFAAAFLALLGIESGKPDELFAAWRTFFERMSDTGPVVLVFEDLHWADPGTLDFIDHLLEWSRNVAIYIVTLARPELLTKRPAWGAGRRNFTSLGLEPLPESAVRDLLAGLVPSLPEATIQTIVERAEGIPLYAIETIRMLVDEGRLAGREDGTYEAVGDVAELAVPPTLTALIAARLDALDPADRTLVMDAAVLGQSFTRAGLAAVSGTPEDDVEVRLQGLVRSELMARVADPLSPERGQYSFVQALVREVAYNTLAKKDRKTRHLAAARYFEALGTDEIAGALAGHYIAAHRFAGEGAEQEALAAQARLALRGAAERAASLGAYEQAMTFYNEALSVVTEPAEAADLLERAGEAASIAAKPDEATEYLREAVRIHRERADEPGLARASASLARVLVLGYQIEAALEVLATAIAETPGVRDLPPGVALDALLARALWLADDPSRALETADRVLAVAERLDLPQIVAEAMYVRGGALCDMSRTYEGIPVIEGAIRMAERLGIPHLALRARNALGAYLVLRQPAAALEVWGAGIAEAQRIGDRANLFRLTNNLVSGWIHTGQWTRAIAELELLISSPLPRTDRIFTLIGLEQVRAFTGKPVEADRRELEALVEHEHDPNVMNMVVEGRAHGALATGKYGDAQQGARKAAAMSPLNAAAALSLGAHAAAWARDRDGLASFQDELLATGAHGGLIDARRQSIAAGLAALDGRIDEALPAFRTAIDEIRSLSAALEEVLTTLDLVAVAGRERVDPALIQAARAKLESWEAVPFLERLDELMALQAPGVQAAGIRSVGQQVPG